MLVPCNSYCNRLTLDLLGISHVWLGGVVVGRQIRDREVASSIPGCSAARCNSGQVVHTHVPLFTKEYKKAQLMQGLRATAPSFQDGRQLPSWILSNRK